MCRCCDSAQSGTRTRATPDQHPHAVALRKREHLRLGATRQQGVRRLLGAKATRPMRVATCSASTMSWAGNVEEPNARTFPAGDQVAHDRERLLDVGRHRDGEPGTGPASRSVDAQARLHGSGDPAARVAARLGPSVVGKWTFVAGSRRRGAPSGRGRRSPPTPRRRTYLRCRRHHAGVQGGAHHALALLVVRIADLAEHHRPETVPTDLHPRPAQRHVAHDRDASSWMHLGRPIWRTSQRDPTIVAS